MKVLVLPVGFLVGCVARGVPDAPHVLRAVVVWLALELLVYPARYQWNDIRGFEADQCHAEGERGRLPGPWEHRRSRIAWSAGVATLRVVLALSLGFLVDRTAGLVVLALGVAVAVLALAYEVARDKGTGRSDKVPPPLTPGIVAIWVLVGSGYALRAVTGLGLAVDLTRPALLLPLGIATSWLFGIAWITSRWAVEATAHADLDDTGALRWSCERGQAREHQLSLVRWLSARPPDGVEDLTRWRAVRSRPAFTAPWFVTGVLSSALAAVTGILLVEPRLPVDVGMTVLAGGLVTGVLVHISGVHRLTAVLAGAGLVALTASLVEVDHPFRAVAAWLAVSVAQERYLRQDRASMGRLLRRPSQGARRGSARRAASWTSTS